MISRFSKSVSYGLLIVFSMLSVIPVAGVLLVSLNKRGTPISGLGLPNGIHLETYLEAWDVAHLSSYLISSFIVALIVVILTVLLSILAGYAYGTMHFCGKATTFYVLLLGMIVPFEALIVPLFYDLRDVGLTNTYWAIAFPQVGVDVAFGTFWMRQYFASIPPSLLEAADIDGVGLLRKLFQVALPPGRPALLTLTLLLFMWCWNEFLTPLVMVSSDNLRTAPLGLAFFAGQHSTDRIGQAAAAVIVSAPIIILFLAFQRSFISGIASGGLKE